jgi:hypothetical protein
MTLRIEDYAIIGDCKTAALVGRDGFRFAGRLADQVRACYQYQDGEIARSQRSPVATCPR